MPKPSTFFYCGGQYVKDEGNPTLEFMTGQTYVEKYEPTEEARSQYPLVFMHGNGQTGTNWMNTPDGREGWASWFLAKGYVVYVLDGPQRGRSSQFASHNNRLIPVPVAYMERYFTAPAEFKLWPQAELHTQWPGTGKKGDAFFDAFMAAQVVLHKDQLLRESLNRRALVDLLNTIGPAILVTHSQGAAAGFAAADSCPNQVQGIVALEPSGPPFMEVMKSSSDNRPYGVACSPLTYDPPVTESTEIKIQSLPCPKERHGFEFYKLQAEPARQLINLLDIPILVVTGEASYHATYDEFTVAFLRQAGIKEVEHLELGKVNIKGNGHMLFMEKNNIEIAELVNTWITSRILGGG